MNRSIFVTLALGILWTMAATLPAMAANPGSKPTTPQAAKTKAKTNKYQEAKDHIRQARALLREFLAENPTGEDAYFANLQLKAIEALTDPSLEPTPVALSGTITWRIVGMDAGEDATKVTLEFHNTDANQSQGFGWFQTNPLSLVDAKGRAYDQKQDGLRMPKETFPLYGNTTVCGLSGGQTVTVNVYFDALSPGVIAGQILYKFNNGAVPAKFNLMNKTLRPAGK